MSILGSSLQRLIDDYPSRKTTRRALSLATLSISGAITSGVLASFVFSGWMIVALTVILGSMGGLFVGVFCQVAGAEV